MLLYISTPQNFRGRYCFFSSTTFIWQPSLLFLQLDSKLLKTQHIDKESIYLLKRYYIQQRTVGITFEMSELLTGPSNTVFFSINLSPRFIPINKWSIISIVQQNEPPHPLFIYLGTLRKGLTPRLGNATKLVNCIKTNVNSSTANRYNSNMLL